MTTPFKSCDTVRLVNTRKARFNLCYFCLQESENGYGIGIFKQTENEGLKLSQVFHFNCFKRILETLFIGKYRSVFEQKFITRFIIDHPEILKHREKILKELCDNYSTYMILEVL